MNSQYKTFCIHLKAFFFPFPYAYMSVICVYCRLLAALTFIMLVIVFKLKIHSNPKSDVVVVVVVVTCGGKKR